MKREIKTMEYQIKSLSIPNNLETELQAWMTAQAKAYQLNWLLANADDGVIWGEIHSDSIHLSCDAFPHISPPLLPMTLQQARLFGSSAEIMLWREGAGWRARVIQDGAGEDGEYYDENHLLWGNQAEDQKEGFLLVRQGKEGLRHAPPLPQDAQLPAHLKVRHYLAYDSDGQVYVACSRLIALQKGGVE